MRAIVVDKNYRQIDELNGKNFRGTFKYKVGAFLGLFGGHEESLPLDYGKLIPNTLPGFLGFFPKTNEKVAYFQYDGKNLTQISFVDVDVQTNIVDYNSNWKQMEYAKNTVLKAPTDNTIELIKWLGIIVVVILMVGTILISNSNYNSLKTARAQDSAQIRNISNRQLDTEILVSNALARDTRAYNASIAVMSRIINSTPQRLG